MNTIRQILAECTKWREPRLVEGNPFRLTCRVGPPASADEIEHEWRGATLPSEVRELWSASRAAELFADADYGQWGLRILSPDRSVERTQRELSQRNDAFRPGDVVLGEFSGDQDLLVVDKEGRVRIALPLDPRADWFQPAPTLTEFLDRYVSTNGAKYWE